MSGVDVMAVLDDLIADMGDLPGTTGHKVALVRYAVAELIAANTELEEANADPRHTLGRDLRVINAEVRTRTAFANLTGGAA